MLGLSRLLCRFQLLGMFQKNRPKRSKIPTSLMENFDGTNTYRGAILLNLTQIILICIVGLYHAHFPREDIQFNAAIPFHQNRPRETFF
jgi:hypothetical protein